MHNGIKKYYLPIGLAAAVVVIILGAIYIPWHKLLPKPSTQSITFLNTPAIQGNKGFALFYDLEVDPAKSTPRGLYKGIAHSGNYSSKAFGKDHYSILVKNKVSGISYPDLDQVRFSAWIYVFPGRKLPSGMLVISVKTPTGENLFWNGVPVEGKYIPREQWFKVSGEADLSGIKIRPDDEITLYFWNRSKTKVLVDDFFMVTGRTPERRGDSARVDFTKSREFTAQYNTPPFQVFDLARENSVKINRAFLSDDSNAKFAGIHPDQPAVAGKFLPSAKGLESVFTVKADGSAELYTFCKEKGQFTRTLVTVSGHLKDILRGAELAAGNLEGTANDQVLIMNGNNVAVATLTGKDTPCDGDEKSPVTLQETWQSTTGGINGTRIGKSKFLLADFNGDRKDELLVFPGDGRWSLYKFTGSGWETISVSGDARIGEWDSGQFDFTLHAGRFVPSASADMILAVFNKKGSRNYRYSLLKYSPAEAGWIPAYPAWSGNAGTTSGLDTLRTTDIYFTGNFTKGASPFFVKYNRDWRFDMKEMNFSDTSFRVIGNIDFTGYEKDYNPKYYEVMRLIPGRFLDPLITSFIVISCNCREYDVKTGDCKVVENIPGLPSGIAFYSFQPLTEPVR